MIAYLTGVVWMKKANSIVLLVDKVGYDVKITSQLLERVVLKEQLELYIHHHISDAAQSLYGFASLGNLKFFETVVNKVSGVGPKIAMGMFALPLEHIKQAILDKDTAFLSKLPGIGKKTAERMCVELIDKIEQIKIIKTKITTSVLDEALGALCALGYTRDEALRALQKVPDDKKAVEDIVRFALKQ